MLRVGSKGVAVAELHEKLNQGGESLPTATGLDDADAMEFTAETKTAVLGFQRRHPPLVRDGVVGKRTWAALDAAVPASTVGRVDQMLLMPTRGKDIFGTQAAYDWAVGPNRTRPTRIRVRVRYDFQEDPKAPLPDHADTVRQLLDGIRTVWNVFKAVEVPVGGGPPRPDVDIEFDPQQGSPADKKVVLSAGRGPSNAGHYFIEPGDDLTGCPPTSSDTTSACRTSTSRGPRITCARPERRRPSETGRATGLLPSRSRASSPPPSGLRRGRRTGTARSPSSRATT